MQGHTNRLLERQGEAAAIERAVTAARAGDGALLVIEGPPGCGKSRLCELAAAVATDAGAVALSARCTELQRAIPFGAVRQLLPFEIAEEEPAAPAADRGLALVEQFARALDRLLYGAALTPDAAAHVLIVDDAQWIDSSSAAFVSHLATRIEGVPVALVVATRSGEGSRDELAAELLAMPEARWIEPGPLSEAAIEQILTEILELRPDRDLVRACARASAGNPFYVIELARELAALDAPPTPGDVNELAPPTVLQGVLARFGGLGSDPVAVASAIAILDESGTIEDAAELAGLDPTRAESAADELERAGLLETGRHLRLSHPLIASTLRADMGGFARAGAHRRAAGILAARGAPEEAIAAQLLFARPAGDHETVERLRAAGLRARRRGEPAAAVAYLSRALEEPAGRPIRPSLLIELAEAEAFAGSPASEEHLAEGLDGLSDPGARAGASAALARTLHHRGDFARAADVAARELSCSPDPTPDRDRLEAAWIAAAILHPPLHEELAGRIAPLIESARDGELPGDPARSAMLAAWLAAQDEETEIVAALAEAAFADDPMVDGDPRGAALGYGAVALFSIDALGVLERRLAAAAEEADRRGAVIALAIVRNFEAMSRYHRGDLEGAVTAAELSLEVHRFGWESSPWSAPTLIAAHVARGDLSAAAEACALAEAAPADRAEGTLLLEARASLRLAQGDPEAALEDARRAGRESEQGYGVTSARLYEWVRIAADAAQAAGRHEEAIDLADEAVARGHSAATARALGRALATAGAIRGGDEGLAELERACAVLADSPSALDHATALVELGAARRRAGRRREGEECLLQALELADGFGAVQLIDRTREELRRLGRRPRRAARSGVEALTPSEKRVAELAALGLSTPQIAHQLYVTRKTVESHLGHVYRKLKVPGRGELPRVLTESGR